MVAFVMAMIFLSSEECAFMSGGSWPLPLVVVMISFALSFFHSEIARGWDAGEGR